MAKYDKYKDKLYKEKKCRTCLYIKKDTKAKLEYIQRNHGVVITELFENAVNRLYAHYRGTEIMWEKQLEAKLENQISERFQQQYKKDYEKLKEEMYQKAFDDLKKYRTDLSAKKAVKEKTGKSIGSFYKKLKESEDDK